MAMMNEILGVAARFNQHLTRKFGLTGGAPSPQLTPEIAPVFAMPVGDEALILQGEYKASGYITAPAVALKKSVAGLFNPTGSNIIVVVEHIEAMPNGAGANISAGIAMGINPYATLPAAGGVTYRDTRVPQDPGGSSATKSPTALLRADADPPAVPNPNLWIRNANSGQELIDNGELAILAPGTMLGMQVIDTQNLAVRYSFWWREIPLAHGEKGPF